MAAKHDIVTIFFEGVEDPSHPLYGAKPGPITKLQINVQGKTISFQGKLHGRDGKQVDVGGKLVGNSNPHFSVLHEGDIEDSI